MSPKAGRNCRDKQPVVVSRDLVVVVVVVVVVCACADAMRIRALSALLAAHDGIHRQPSHAGILHNCGR